VEVVRGKEDTRERGSERTSVGISMPRPEISVSCDVLIDFELGGCLRDEKRKIPHGGTTLEVAK
jgi:hypothetical protein